MLYSFSCSQGTVGLSSVSGAFKCYDSTNTVISGVPVTLQPVSLQPESIDAQSNFTDGATLGWGVAAAMAAAWAVVHLRKALFR